MKLDKSLYHDIQLKNVQMIGLNCSYNEKNEVSNRHNLPINISIENGSKVLSTTRGICYLKVKVEFEDKMNELFNVEVSYRGLCEAIKDINEGDMEFYLKLQSVPMLWAYARETINNTIVKMGLPPIVLPAVNINKMIDIISNEENDNLEED